MNFEITLSPENRTGKVTNYAYEHKLLSTATSTQKLSKEKFMKAVTPPYSRTWSNIVFSGNRTTANFQSMQVIALDFDNTNTESIITPDMVVERCQEEGFDVSFIYSTFSHTNELPRFRAVWILDTAINHPTDAKHYIDILYQMFPEADSGAKDLARIWLGGKEIVYRSDYILSVDQITELGGLQVIARSSDSNKSRNLNTYLKKTEPAFNSTIKEVQKSSFSPVRYKECERKKYDWEFVRSKCKTLDKLVTAKEKVWHPDLTYLASNMHRMKGGEKLYKESIEANPHINNDKKDIISYIKSRWNKPGYTPILPYRFRTLPEKHIDHKLKFQYNNILEIFPHGQYSKAMLLDEPELSMPLKETRDNLKTEMDKALADTSNAIYVFRCATGIGKTRLAINRKESVALAFPTHALKEEMYAAATIPCEMIPRIPLDALPTDMTKRYNKYCDAGLVRKASHMIRKIADNPYRYNLDKDQATKLVAYFKQLEKCLKTDSTIFTTHQKCIHMNFENKDTYIFDEDPFYAFAKTNSCTTADLRILANTLMTKDNAVDAHKIECITDAMNNYIDIFADTLNIQQFDDSESVVQAIQECAAKKEIRGNVFGLLMHPKPMFYVQPVNNKDPKGDKKISYTTYVPLRDDKKYIILSATASEYIYRKLYGDRVKFIDLSNVETKGEIHQFSNVGYSRKSMDKNPKRVKLADNFKKELPTITFKTHRSEFTNPVDGIHFGNCEGSNKLEGQDIKIVGTPHLDSTAYRLICKLLDIPASSSDFEFERMKVKNNGYEFNFVTSINPDVRSIQFYCIEKDLIQAVGRARLVNHNCTVYLFSDYPVPYAEQHSLSEIPTPVIQLQPNNIDKEAA